MGRNISVEISVVIYSGATAPAKDQVEMLQIAPATGDFGYAVQLDG
ncbi:hypothetical protein ACTVMR_00080 [Serratia nevei]